VVKDNLNCFLFLAIAPSPLENWKDWTKKKSTHASSWQIGGKH
jgi:hypothetical protein